MLKKKRFCNKSSILNIGFFFFQLLLTIMAILLVFNINPASALILSIKSREPINGNDVPYLVFGNDKTKLTNDALAGIKINGQYYIATDSSKELYPNAKVNTSSETAPIEVPAGTKFSDIQTLVPLPADNPNYPKMFYRDLDVSFYAEDDDGDQGYLNQNYINNYLFVKWGDNYNADWTQYIKEVPNEQLDSCFIYNLEVGTNNSLGLSSYGLPSNSFFYMKSKYYIKVKSDNNSFVCLAKPEKRKDSFHSGGDPTNYNNNYGAFIVRNGADVTHNFPTTGLNNMIFTLYLKNITAEQVIAANGHTVLPDSGSNSVKLQLNNISPEKIAVQLNGPDYNSTDGTFRTFIPTEFKLYADTSHTKIVYAFKLERWYIHRGITEASRYHLQNCSYKTGYRLAFLPDVVNANVGNWHGGLPGNNAYAKMAVSYRNNEGNWVGGFFNEWGFPWPYVSPYFFAGYFEDNGSYRSYIMDYSGYVYQVSQSDDIYRDSLQVYGLCVSP